MSKNKNPAPKPADSAAPDPLLRGGDPQDTASDPLLRGGDPEGGVCPPPPFDRARATPIDPARRHEPTARTIAWEQDGHYYTATGQPVAPIDPIPSEEGGTR